MKIGLVLASNIYLSPHMKYYTDILDKLDIDYDVICWNRVENDETFGYSSIEKFEYTIENKGPLDKIKGYYKYNSFIKEKLKNNSYDYVIVFTLQLAVMLSSILVNLYRNKYLIDIRDYTSFVKFKRATSKVIKNSRLNVVSSKGYLTWLPENKYVISHNCRICDLKLHKKFESNNHAIDLNNIKIATIGNIRDYKANIEVIDSIKNDGRFKLHYVGKGTCEDQLKEYCNVNNISNIEFKGYYAKKDEINIYSGYDIINNYTGKDINGLTLMSNRFYNSLITNKPMIFLENSFMCNYGMENNIGIIMKQNTLKEDVLNFFNSDEARKKYEIGRLKVIEQIYHDIYKFEEELTNIFRKE